MNKGKADVSAPQAPQKKARVFRSKKKANTATDTRVRPFSPISDEAMEKLARLMNDSPTIAKMHGTEWEIHALKPGTQWLIAEEACKIVRNDNMTMGDIVKQFAVNMPAVCRTLTLALLNDKERIYGEEYQEVYDTLMWGDYALKDWATLLMEVFNLIDVDFFFASTNAIQTVRSILKRRTTAVERERYIPVQNTEQ